MESLGLVGRSAAMVDLYRWIDRASTASDLPVLITGETGTGKELVARAVHRLDPKRSRGPLVPVNCIALSSGIADSELFGHRRGSFTGAIDDHRGFFRTADRGVLFLDEIADLEPALQGKLLRVLQDGRVTAVGENREVAVSVRVIAATNKDLPSLIAEGRFRLDLLHRLAVLEVRLPPLSERRDDVALLVEHFVEKHASLRTRRLTAYPGFVEAIQAIALPGNVRQLENIVRRALAGRPDDDSLGVEDLPPQLLLHGSGCREPSPRDVALPQAQPAGSVSADHPPGTSAEWSAFLAAHSGCLSACLGACELELLNAALTATRGNQSQAARLLGITPRGLYAKRRRHAL